MSKLVPASTRATGSIAAPLTYPIKHLLSTAFNHSISVLQQIFPPISPKNTLGVYGRSHHPRLLLCGNGNQGQTSHIAPAILHNCDHLPVHKLHLPAMYSVSSRTPEEATAVVSSNTKTWLSIHYFIHKAEGVQWLIII